jgi:hypothetical protein
MVLLLVLVLLVLVLLLPLLLLLLLSPCFPAAIADAVVTTAAQLARW